MHQAPVTCRHGGIRAAGLATILQAANILFLLVDDQRWDALGCVGNSIIGTPAIDRRQLRLSLKGKLAGDSVAELERCCQALTSLDPGATLLIDVRALESADENGYRLLDTMRRIMSAWGRILSCPTGQLARAII